MATIVAPPEVSPETKALLVAYLDALTLAEPIQARLWQLAKLTLTQLSVLRELRAGPQTAGRLGEAVGLSPTSLSRLVDRLERRGLVSRSRDADDRRYVDVRLEPTGERLLGEIRVLRGSALHLAAESMQTEDRRELTLGLRRLVALTRAIAEQGRGTV